MNNFVTAALALADSPIPHWAALLTLTSLTIAGLYRLDRRLEQRRRTRDLRKLRAQVLALNETTETVTWTKEPTW